MAIRHDVRPEEVGRRLAAELARAGSVVQGLWMTVPRGVPTFWILTQPIDFEAQQRLYTRANVLYDQFPSIEFTVHILNPAWFSEGAALNALPAEAQQLAVSPT